MCSRLIISDIMNKTIPGYRVSIFCKNIDACQRMAQESIFPRSVSVTDHCKNKYHPNRIHREDDDHKVFNNDSSGSNNSQALFRTPSPTIAFIKIIRQVSLRGINITVNTATLLSSEYLDKLSFIKDRK